MASFGKVVLSYGDYIIRASEMSILGGPNWLNDVIIGFYMEYLMKEVYPPGPQNKLRFIGPEVTQCLKMSGPEDTLSLMGSLEGSDFVFWVLNNSEDPEELNGGSHWSVLVYSRLENVIAHFDSAGLNSSSADMLYRLLSKVITPRPSFQIRGCEAQQNGYDCGLHTICNVKIIADFVSKTKCLNGVTTAKAPEAQAMRARLVELIKKKVGEVSPGTANPPSSGRKS